MKRKQQEMQAERLLDVIGGIDDRFVQEALEWRSQGVRTVATQRRGNMRVLMIAASLMLVVALSISGSLMAKLNHSENDLPSDSVNSEPVPDPSWDQLLTECLKSDAFETVREQDLNYFDGSIRLTVQDRTTGAFYVSRPLYKSETTLLSRELNEKGKSVDANAEADPYRIWVLLGDGQVLTPCLTPSAGNIGAAELFAYESERIPSEIFETLLKNLQ